MTQDCARETSEELKSEKNRVMSWVVWPARISVKDCSSDKHLLMSLMFCQEKDADNEHVKAKCDMTMLLRSIGGSGGVRLVADVCFYWGETSVRISSKELTVADGETKGRAAFRKAKQNHVESRKFEV